jgi:uncharacterized repeat protein (TIGR01451 family)
MLKIKTLLTGSAIGVVAASGLYASPALAAGTAAGSTIHNEVTVSYQVGGVGQTDETASDDIIVDRKVNLTVARVDDVATSVAPGATNQAVSYLIENTSNGTLDFALAAAQVATSGAAGISGTDSFDVTASPFVFYLDDGNGVFDGGDGSPILHLDALGPDSPVVVHAVATSVPLGLSTGDIAAVVLTVTAKENDNGTALGSDLVEASSNTALEDTIFADGAGATDGSRDAAYSWIDDYIVFAASISASKTSTILSNGANFNTGTAIPGATIQYCITVDNASGGAAASSLVISDTLPAEVTFDSGFGVLVGGTDCSDLVTDNGSGDFTDPVVSGTIANLPAGDSQTLIFRATID